MFIFKTFSISHLTPQDKADSVCFQSVITIKSAIVSNFLHVQENPLALACWVNNMEIVRLLLDQTDVDLNSTARVINL